jgi:GTP-binding protein
VNDFMTAPAPTPRALSRLSAAQVGKSTLYNRLAGRRAAIVEDVPGVTRDRHYADLEWDGRELTVVDTGGFEPKSRDPLVALVERQAQLAVDEAAVIVLVVDVREGLTSVDQAVADLLRRAGKPLLVAVNKIDAAKTEAEAPLAEFHRLGFGEVHALSAEHGRGVGDLLEAVLGACQPPPQASPPIPGPGREGGRGDWTRAAAEATKRSIARRPPQRRQSTRERAPG